MLGGRVGDRPAQRRIGRWASGAMGSTPDTTDAPLRSSSVVHGPPTAARPARVHADPPLATRPQTPRRTELGLLVFASVIITALYVFAVARLDLQDPAPHRPVPGHLVRPAAGAPPGQPLAGPQRQPVVLPIVALLNGIGYVVIARYDPPYAPAQAGWTAIGVFLYMLTLLVVRRLARPRPLPLPAPAVGGALLISPLVPHVGVEIHGARLWVHFGRDQFQPVEFAKLLLCIFFASYFAEKKELLAIPTARLGQPPGRSTPGR